MEKEKWKLSIEDYHQRIKDGKSSDNFKTSLDPRLRLMKRQSIAKPIELKVVRYAPRTSDRRLKQYVRRLTVPQRRNSEPGKSLSTMKYSSSNVSKGNVTREQPLFPTIFPSSSDILAKSRNSLKSGLLNPDKVNSDTLKRHFVSNGGTLVPLPYKRTRWSIESMEKTEPFVSETANLKSDVNQSSFTKSSTDKATTFDNNAKLTLQHSNEIGNTDTAKDSVVNSVKKDASSNATDQPSPSAKVSTSSICSRSNADSEKSSSKTNTKNEVYESTSGNLSNCVIISPKRKITITPDAKVVIEFENSSPKEKDTHGPKTKFFKKSKYGCSSPKRNAFPTHNPNLFKKRSVEYKSKLFRKSTNEENLKADPSKSTKDKEICFEAVEKNNNVAPTEDRTLEKTNPTKPGVKDNKLCSKPMQKSDDLTINDDRPPEKSKSVGSSTDLSETTNDLAKSALFSPKRKETSPNKSLNKNKKPECNSKPFQNLFEQGSIDAKPKDSDSCPKPVENTKDLPVIKESTLEKKPVKSKSESSLAGSLSLSKIWSKERNSSITTNGNLNKKRKSESNFNPSPSKNQRNSESNSNVAEDTDLSVKPKQKTNSKTNIKECNVKKSQPVKSSSDSSLTANYLAVHNTGSRKRSQNVTSNASLKKKRKPECDSKPLEKSKDQKNSESKSKNVVEKNELSAKAKQKANDATEEENIRNKNVKSSSDSSPSTNCLATNNARSPKKTSSIESNTGLVKNKISVPFCEPLDKRTSEPKPKCMLKDSELRLKPMLKTGKITVIKEQNIDKTKSTKSTDSSSATNSSVTCDALTKNQKNNDSDTRLIKKRRSDHNFKPSQKRTDHKNSESKLKDAVEKKLSLKKKGDVATIEEMIFEKSASVKCRTESFQKSTHTAKSTKLSHKRNNSSSDENSVKIKKIENNFKMSNNKKISEPRSKDVIKGSDDPCCKPTKTADLDINEKTAEKRNSLKSSSLSFNKTSDLTYCNTGPAEVKSDKTSKKSTSPLIMSNSPVKKGCAQIELLTYSEPVHKCDKKCFAKSGKIDCKYCLNDSRLKSLQDSAKENIKSSVRVESQKLAKQVRKVNSTKNPDFLFSKSNFELLKKSSKFRRIYKIGSTKKRKIGIKYRKNMVKIKKKRFRTSSVHILGDTNKPKSRRQSSESVKEISKEDSRDVLPFELYHSGVEDVVITDVRHFPDIDFEHPSDIAGSPDVSDKDSDIVLTYDSRNESDDSEVIITDVVNCSKRDRQLVSDCETSLNMLQEESNIVSPFTMKSNCKVSDKSEAQSVPSTTSSISNKIFCSQFNTPLSSESTDNQASRKCYEERNSTSKGKNFVLTYKKYENGKMALIMLDLRNQTCKRIPLRYLFASKTISSTSLPVEVIKKSLNGPSILNALSVECCIGFILSEVFLYKTVAEKKHSNLKEHCLVFSILRHLKIHSQCEVHNLLFKSLEGLNKELKLKASCINLQRVVKILSKGILKSGHWERGEKTKSVYPGDSIYEPYSFRCSNVPYIDKFFNSFNCIKYADTFNQTCSSSQKLFCTLCLLNYEEFSREYLTGVFSGRLFGNESIGSCHNPCICVEHFSNLENIHKDSFCASLKKKGISFNVLKMCENLIDFSRTRFHARKCVSNSVLKCLPYLGSLKDMPFSMFKNVFLKSTNQGFEDVLKELCGPFSFVREDRKSSFYFVFTQNKLATGSIEAYRELSNKKIHPNVIVNAANNSFDQKYFLALNSLKLSSQDLFTYVYESVFKLITSQRSILTLFPLGLNTPEPPLEVSPLSIEFSHTNYMPGPSHPFYIPEAADEVKEKGEQLIPQNSVTDTSATINSLKSPCIGNLLFFYKRNITLHCSKDYDDMFLPLDLFKKDSVMGRYYDHLRKTGPHELGFSFINVNSMSEGNMVSYNFLIDQLNYHKSVLQGLICIASEPGTMTSHDIIKRITEELEMVAGYEVACKALLV